MAGPESRLKGCPGSRGGCAVVAVAPSLKCTLAVFAVEGSRYAAWREALAASTVVLAVTETQVPGVDAEEIVATEDETLPLTGTGVTRSCASVRGPETATEPEME